MIGDRKVQQILNTVLRIERELRIKNELEGKLFTFIQNLDRMNAELESAVEANRARYADILDTATDLYSEISGKLPEPVEEE